MSSTANTTHTPGTVKGTARVTATELTAGMRIRFTGDRAKSSDYRSDVDRVELHGTALIVSVRSELRGQKAYRSKRSRWYVLELAGGQVTSVSPASRHNVLANLDGSPFIDSLDTLADVALEALEAEEAPEAEAPAVEAQVREVVRSTQERVREDVLAALKTTEAQPPSAVGRRAKVGTSTTWRILNDLEREGLAVGVGNGSRRRWRRAPAAGARPDLVARRDSVAAVQAKLAAPASEEAPTLRLVLVDHCPQGQLF